jgi:cob(I)alamin adenosyltransferase
MSLYTKYGDEGYTYTKISVKTPKNHPLVHFLGNLDELNCAIGMLVCELKCRGYSAMAILNKKIMEVNFEIGAFVGYGTPLDFQYVNDIVKEIEKSIDTQEEVNGKLKNFILPTGVYSSVCAHQCRAIARRVERSIYELEITAECELIIQFLNRISDYFFSVARTVNRTENGEEIIWQKRQ